MTTYSLTPSPVGELMLVGDGERLRGLYMEEHRRGPLVDPAWRRDDGAFAAARAQLAEYFAGERRAFDLDLDPVGTEWQLRVWDALRRIPYGETASYGELAASVCTPAAARAVGAANARNPISIVVPCHRVVGASGLLTGYAGGVERKRWLLDHERGALALALAKGARHLHVRAA
jgi:methylated-DNA-[protein]-cysteine S-methyltransferase